MNVKTCKKPEKKLEPPKDSKLDYCEQLRKKEEKNRLKEDEAAGIYQSASQESRKPPPPPPPPPPPTIAVCIDKIKNCPPKPRKEGEKEPLKRCRVAVEITGDDICEVIEEKIRNKGILRDSGPSCSPKAVVEPDSCPLKKEVDPCEKLRKEQKKKECEEKRRRYFE